MNKKIKVLHAFNKYMPNSQNWAYNLINALPDVDVYIYAENYEKTNFYNSDWDYLDLKEVAIIKYIKGILNRSNFILKPFVEKIYKYLQNKKNKKFLQLIEKKKISILHSHFGHYSCEINDIIKNVDVKHVVSFYGHDYERVPFTIPKYVKLYQELFLNADKFICEGNHGAEILVKLGCPFHKISVVHLGIDTSKFQFSISSKKEKSLKIVQIASITEKKGHIYSVKAFIKALEKSPNMQLTLVGNVKDNHEKYLLEEIENEIKHSGCASKIKLIKRIDYSLLYKFLENYDVFIHPSTYAKDKDCEGGAPVVLLDAQACGLPIISTFHCDIPDEVIHEKTGLLCNEKDIESISDNISKFYNMSNEEFQKFRENAFIHVKEEYDVHKSGNELREVYKELIS